MADSAETDSHRADGYPTSTAAALVTDPDPAPESAPQVSAPQVPPQRSRPRLAGGSAIAGAAVLIAVATVASRVVGFGRWLVFSHSVGAGALADAYNSANQLPNIVFELTAGGALAGVAVPLLAGPLTGIASAAGRASRAGGSGGSGSTADTAEMAGGADKPAGAAHGSAATATATAIATATATATATAVATATADRARASRIVSALLTWALAVLIPLSLSGVLLAGPIAEILGSGHDSVYTGQISRFLVFFLPQIPLYGAAVVLGATLQADRRFLAPALAPLMSSLVVVASYTVFAFMDRGRGAQLRGLAYAPELVLALGTSAGVLILVLSLLPAVRRAKLSFRPTFRFPEGVAKTARSLGAAGLATLVAQQLAVLTVVLLANAGHAVTGTLTVFNLVWAVYSLPYAVLAVPVATSAFTDLSARWAADDRAGYSRGVAMTTQAVLIFSTAGATILAAAAWPTARLFLTARHGTGGGLTVEMMGRGLIAFAPGLVGYGLLAHLSRALYAAGRGRAAAGSVCAGWLTVLVCDVVLVSALPGRHAVFALGLGNTVGMTVAGLLLLAAMKRAGGPDSLRGVGRAGAVAGIAAAVASPVGVLAAAIPGSTGPLPAAVIGVSTALVTAGVFVGVAMLATRRLLPNTECAAWLRETVDNRRARRGGQR